jgi:hypothetical protein
VVIDVIRRYEPPFSPTEVIGQMCRELRRFDITRVHGDYYSAEFTKSAIEQRGIKYGKHTRDDFAKNPSVSRAAKLKSQL